MNVIAQLDALGEQVGRVLDELARQVRRDLGAGNRRRAADLDIEGLVLDALSTAEGPFAGAGFVAAPGVLDDQRYWLEWWTTSAGRPARLTVQSDPDAEDFRDYTRLPWFAGPATSGAASLVGPYVDYLCSDEYMLTFTEPVHQQNPAASADEFLGVVGLDVRVAWVETHLAASLTALSRPALLVNRSNRVVACARTEYLPGDLVRAPDSWPERLTGRLPLDLLL